MPTRSYTPLEEYTTKVWVLFHCDETLSLDLINKAPKGLFTAASKERWINGWLHYASCNDNLSMARKLVDNGPDPTSLARSGRSSIHAAAFSNSYKVLNFFLENKANPNVIDENKYTPLDYAEEKKRKKRGESSIQLLEKYGGLRYQEMQDSNLNTSHEYQTHGESIDAAAGLLVLSESIEDNSNGMDVVS